MAVEEVFEPVRSVFGVCQLNVQTHDGGDQLGDEENGQSGQDFWIKFHLCICR